MHIIRVVMFFIGILFMIIGLTNTIIYLSLLSIGYSFFEYLSFIFRRIDCLIYILGLIIVCLTVYRKGEKYDLYL